MRGLFLCFALAVILKVFFVFDGSVTTVSYGSKLVDIGDHVAVERVALFVVPVFRHLIAPGQYSTVVAGSARGSEDSTPGSILVDNTSR